MLPRRVEDSLPLLRRDPSPDVVRRQGDADRACAAREETPESSHGVILPRCAAFDTSTPFEGARCRVGLMFRRDAADRLLVTYRQHESRS
jgi:hypothetical protein